MSDLHCPARILVARHGEADYESDIVRQDAGGSLSVLGRSQARGLGERLQHERVAAVYCSELARAVQTAEIAAAVLGLPVTVRESLQEFHVGVLVGKPMSERFRHVLAAWRNGDLTASIPEGESGEQVVARVLPVLEAIADTMRGETALVVVHGGVIEALLGAFAPVDGETDGIGNCTSYIFERDADGWRVTG